MSEFIEIAEAEAGAALVEHISDLIGELFSHAGIIVSVREREKGRWRIEVILPPGESWGRIAPLLADLFPAPLPAFSLRRIARSAWEASPQPEFKPVRAGRFFVHDSRHQPHPGAGTLIEIEAGLAFGTGHHGSTSGCLMALDRALKSRRFQKILDLGCGSGILAIAAAKTTRARILASDIDPVAIAVARHNAVRNAVSPLIGFRIAEGLHDPTIRARAPYDLVMANILAGPLLRFAEPLAGLTAPGATVILSGLLTSQAARIAARYAAAGFILQNRLIINEWATLTLVSKICPKKRALFRFN